MPGRTIPRSGTSPERARSARVRSRTGRQPVEPLVVQDARQQRVSQRVALELGVALGRDEALAVRREATRLAAAGVDGEALPDQEAVDVVELQHGAARIVRREREQVA